MVTNKLCLNAAEVSERTGLSLSTVRKLTRCREIPHIKVGRRILYPLTEIEDWLSKNIIGSPSPEKDGDISG